MCFGSQTWGVWEMLLSWENHQQTSTYHKYAFLIFAVVSLEHMVWVVPVTKSYPLALHPPNFLIWNSSSLVVDLPLWKICLRQLGLLLFPVYGKIIQMFQWPPTSLVRDEKMTSWELEAKKHQTPWSLPPQPASPLMPLGWQFAGKKAKGLELVNATCWAPLIA